VLVAGALYHVYCRFRSGLRVFAEPEEAEHFLALLREVKQRDGFAILAWCFMPTHYHLALRMGEVTLSRSFRRLQGNFAQWWNHRYHTLGPLWQSRFKARLVTNEAYFSRVVAYIHRNPVAAGLVKDPTWYPWSGHRELLVDLPDPLADAAAALALFDETTTRARAIYAALMDGLAGENWTTAEPGSLPWWPRTSGRDAEANEAQTVRGPMLDPLGGSDSPLRPALDAGEFLRRACQHEEIATATLRSRRRDRATVTARELLAVLAVEGYCIRVTDLAAIVDRPADTVSRWVSRGAERRSRDSAFATRIRALDEAVRRTDNRAER
jgi:REP element-mobilizing transposase RayT